MKTVFSYIFITYLCKDFITHQTKTDHFTKLVEKSKP